MNSSEGKNTVPDMPRAEKVLNSLTLASRLRLAKNDPDATPGRAETSDFRTGRPFRAFHPAGDAGKLGARGTCRSNGSRNGVASIRRHSTHGGIRLGFRSSTPISIPQNNTIAALLERLAEHCHAGWGEIEIQLHHGVDVPDTAENTRAATR